MNIIFRKITPLIIITFLLSSCTSELSWQSRHYVKNSPFKEKNTPKAMKAHKDRQLDYLIKDHNKKNLSVDVGNVCRAASLIGIISPIPFIPRFTIASDYKVRLSSFEDNKLREDKVFKNLKVELKVDENKYIGQLQPLHEQSTSRYYKFPIKCSKFNKGKLRSKDLKGIVLI